MLPPHAENKHLSFSLKYLCKIMKKSQGNISTTVGRAEMHSNLSAPEHRAETFLAAALPTPSLLLCRSAVLYAKICRGPEILLFR